MFAEVDFVDFQLVLENTALIAIKNSVQLIKQHVMDIIK
jgi:hypothetical protein